MHRFLSNKKHRLYGEVAILLALAGVFARLNSARALDGSGPGSQTVAPWGNLHRSYVGSNDVTVGMTRRVFTNGAGEPTNPDFRHGATSGGGRYADIMADQLAENGKPVFRSTGTRVEAVWTDSAGNPIVPPRDYIAAKPGDAAGRMAGSSGDAVTSAATFNQWFNDTPGVNNSARSPLVFSRQGTGYVFDGSFDGPAGSPPDYTVEMEYPFVYESGRDWYFSTATDAEVWVFIDGKLVIDGGGLRGVAFSITNGAVVPQQTVNASMTVVGTAIQSGSTLLPVTTMANVGNNVYAPFGLFTDPTRGNVRLSTLPRTVDLQSNVAAGTPIYVHGASWINSRGDWARHLTAVSSPATQQVRVLRNGDAVPDIRPFANQTSVAAFLSPYVNAATRRITLRDDQVIFLFELGTTDMRAAAADFQDLVVLVNLEPIGGSNTEPDTTTTTGSGVPMFTQRISLSRLGWLQDRGSHTLKILFANRTGAASHVRLETNITTLNLANMRSAPGVD